MSLLCVLASYLSPWRSRHARLAYWESQETEILIKVDFTDSKAAFTVFIYTLRGNCEIPIACIYLKIVLNMVKNNYGG